MSTEGRLISLACDSLDLAIDYLNQAQFETVQPEARAHLESALEKIDHACNLAIEAANSLLIESSSTTNYTGE